MQWLLAPQPTVENAGKSAGLHPSKNIAEPATHWSCVPDDLLRRIFASLAPPDLACVGGVTKNWRLAANDRALWRKHAMYLCCPQDATAAELKSTYARAQNATANIRAGRPTRSRFLPPNKVVDVAWSPDGSKLACASDDGTAFLFRAETGTQLMDVPTHRGNHDGSTVHWSPDGSKLAIKRSDLTVIDASTGATLKRIDGGGNYLNTCIWSPDSSKLALWGSSCEMCVANFATGACFRIASDTWPQQGCWSPDSRKVLSCKYLASPLGEALTITDAVTGLHSVALHFNPYETLAGFSLNWIEGGKTIAVSPGNGETFIIDAALGTEVNRYHHGDEHEEGMNCSKASLSPDKSKMVSFSKSRAMRIFRPLTGEMLACLSGPGEGFGLPNPQWSPDSTKLLYFVSERTARISDAQTWATIALVRCERVTSRCHWSPNSKNLLLYNSGALDNYKASSRIVDATNGETLLNIAHTDIRPELSWSPDSIMVAVIEPQPTPYGPPSRPMAAITAVRIFDTATRSELPSVFHGDALRYMTWHPDGTKLISWHYRGRARFTEFSPHNKTATFSNARPGHRCADIARRLFARLSARHRRRPQSVPGPDVATVSCNRSAASARL